jgi:hypothetical protein
MPRERHVVRLQRAPVLLHHGREGRVHEPLDRRCRAEARAQVDGRGASRDELILHRLVRADIRAPETVDRLLRVADDEELAGGRGDVLPPGGVRIRRRQEQQELGLERIGVLELVHEDVRQPPLQIGAHVRAVAHEVAGAQQEVEKIERRRARLQRLVTIDRLEELGMEQRREVGVGLTLETLERGQELAVHPDDLIARAALVVARLPGAWLAKLPFAQEIDQRRFETVVIAAHDALARAQVLVDPAHRPEVGEQRIGRRRACRERVAQRGHLRDERVDRRVAVERRPLPRRAQIPPVGELPARPTKPVHRIVVRRPPPQRASHTLRRRFERLGEPRAEHAAIERFRLRLGQHVEPRIDTGFHRPLVEHVVAEPVNGRHARFLEPGDRLFQAPAAGRPRLRALPRELEAGPQAELQLARRLLGERQGRDAVDAAAAFREDVDDARDQLGRLPGAGGRFHDEGLVERGRDTRALGGVDERRHGRLRKASSSASRSGSFFVIRVSSPGPHTGRKSQMPHARRRGAAGRNPAATARSTTPRTSRPRARASAVNGTTASVNPPARVQ